MSEPLNLRNVLISTDDLSSALADFALLGISPAFRDGDDYAVLDLGGGQLGIALAAPHDHPAPGQPVLTVKAEHVRVAADELVSKGAVLVTPPYRGAHETRALLRTSGGVLLMIYGPQE
jgi:hypothetical protein